MGTLDPRNITGHKAHLDQCWADLTADQEKVGMLVDRLGGVGSWLRGREAGADLETSNQLLWMCRAVSALRMELMVRCIERMDEELKEMRG